MMTEILSRGENCLELKATVGNYTHLYKFTDETGKNLDLLHVWSRLYEKYVKNEPGIWMRKWMEHKMFHVESGKSKCSDDDPNVSILVRQHKFKDGNHLMLIGALDAKGKGSSTCYKSAGNFVISYGLSWQIERLLWIGFLEESSIISKLPKDIVKEIIKFLKE
jgi:hypothetical protein